jgi:hypothetical protein
MVCAALSLTLLPGCFGVAKIRQAMDARGSDADGKIDTIAPGDGAPPDTGPASDRTGAADAGSDDDGGPADDGGDDGAATDDGGDTDGIGMPVDAATDSGTGDSDIGATDAATDTPGTDASGADGPAPCSGCTSYGTPQALGTVPAVLRELSGLAASRLHPGLLYTHNDSGDSARFFALDETATLRAEVDLSDATATDWEAISVGSCPSGTCVYVGDTGDNDLNRDEYVIYRVPEPATLPSDGSKITVTTYDRLPFVYPDARHNAETVLVHPITGQIFVIIKEKGVYATVFEMPMPLSPGTRVTLRAAATLSISPVDGIVTDGAFHPCGDRVLVRTTLNLFELTRPAGGTLLSVFGATPTTVPLAVEPKGESVTYALDGTRYFTSSETVSGQPTPSLSVVGCANH